MGAFEVEICRKIRPGLNGPGGLQHCGCELGLTDCLLLSILIM